MEKLLNILAKYRVPNPINLNAITEIYNLGIEDAAEKAEVLMTVNDLPFVANNFSITTENNDESFIRKYTVYKPSILNLRIPLSLAETSQK